MWNLVRRRPAATVQEATAVEPQLDVRSLVGSLSRQASTLGRDAAEVRGALGDTARDAKAQADSAHQLAGQIRLVLQGQQSIDEEVQRSLAAAHGARSAVQSLGAEVAGIVETLRQVADAAGQITQIAMQTRLVAFNASVEAKRAGEAGRGFGVVADAVKALAARVETSSKDIMGTVSTLETRIEALSRETRLDTEETQAQGQMHRSLQQVQHAVERIGGATAQGREHCAQLADSLSTIESTMQRTSATLDHALGRTETFLQVSEHMIEAVAGCGIETEDTRYIRAAQEAARQIGVLLEDALRTGAISENDLFDERYKAVPGTDPAQHLARFTELAERLFPQVQEKLLGVSDKVVFGIAADRNGYIACHNAKYNQAQRPGDPVWNAANCRNHRIFDDRTGLASARCTKPFLLQTYRRDMGGGNFVVMKEAAAPIRVGSRHWGGLRLGFRF